VVGICSYRFNGRRYMDFGWTVLPFPIYTRRPSNTSYSTIFLVHIYTFFIEFGSVMVFVLYAIPLPSFSFLCLVILCYWLMFSICSHGRREWGGGGRAKVRVIELVDYSLLFSLYIDHWTL
jgi:hypothetical protein